MDKKQIAKDIARYVIPKIGKAVQDQVIPKVIEQLPKVKTKVSDVIASRKAGNVLEDITAVVPLVAAVTVADDVVEAVAVESEKPSHSSIMPKVFVGVAVAGAVVAAVVTVGKIVQAIGQHGRDEEEATDDEVESAACTADDDVERAIFTAIANKIA